MPADSIVTYGVKLAGIKSLYINGKIGEMGKAKGPVLGGIAFCRRKSLSLPGERQRVVLELRDRLAHIR
jgi:hypothetical protein